MYQRSRSQTLSPLRVFGPTAQNKRVPEIIMVRKQAETAPAALKSCFTSEDVLDLLGCDRKFRPVIT